MAWFKWAQEGSTQIGVTLDVLKLQKEKASNKSLDLPKAFISSVFTFFPGVDCIKMRFYTSAIHLIFPFLFFTQPSGLTLETVTFHNCFKWYDVQTHSAFIYYIKNYLQLPWKVIPDYSGKNILYKQKACPAFAHKKRGISLLRLLCRYPAAAPAAMDIHFHSIINTVFFSAARPVSAPEHALSGVL